MPLHISKQHLYIPRRTLLVTFVYALMRFARFPFKYRSNRVNTRP
ncbi:Hydroxyacylglutathione hydrolase (plasmid) [Sinorhizobium sp. CCBAU 05631]|nr:Hydroxyacylglutathione hydrolase [Sinorhizobium sp. CCBAU 05631]